MWFKPKSEIQKTVTELNYETDQNGIVNRMLRENGAWNSHLENTKNAIMQSAEGKTGTCVVLGSGWLLDVPLKELAEQFSKVYLVDIVHPAYVKSKVQKFENVTLIIADITSGLANFVRQTNKLTAAVLAETVKLQFSPSATNFFNNTLQIDVPDFVISVNLLNQLDILLIEYLAEQFEYKNQDFKQLRQSIQTAHLNLLPVSKTCLITDFYKNEYNLQNNDFLNKESLIFCNLPFNQAKSTWSWNFDSTGTYTKNKKIVFEVAWYNL